MSKYIITISTDFGKVTIDGIEASNEQEAFNKARILASEEFLNHGKLVESHQYDAMIYMNVKANLLSQIKPDNLKLLDEEDRDNEYWLEKVLAWQEEYSDDKPWDEFKELDRCGRCNSWTEGGGYQCICYAR